MAASLALKWQPTWPMHIAQATACTMAFVVAIVTCLGRELLRTVVRTEPEWTFGDLYAYTSRRQNTSESEVFSLVDVLKKKQFYPTCAKMFEAVHITIVTQL